MRSGDGVYDLLAPASLGVTQTAAWARGALDPGRFSRRSCTLAQSVEERKGRFICPASSCFLLLTDSGSPHRELVPLYFSGAVKEWGPPISWCPSQSDGGGQPGLWEHQLRKEEQEASGESEKVYKVLSPLRRGAQLSDDDSSSSRRAWMPE